MRTEAAINADIESHRAALRKLQAERRTVRASNKSMFVSEWQAGFTIADIAAEYGVSEATVRAKLWRAGLTSKGRTAIRARLREAGEARPW